MTTLGHKLAKVKCMKVGLAAHVAESNQKVAFQLQLIAQYCSVGSHYKVLLCVFNTVHFALCHLFVGFSYLFSFMEYLCFLEGKRNYLFVPLSVSVCVCERKRVGSAVGKKSHNIQTENQIL